jgi:hypothetical protein
MDSDALYRISGARTEYRKSEWYKIHRILREDEHVSNIRDPELRKDRLKRVMPAVGLSRELVISSWTLRDRGLTLSRFDSTPAVIRKISRRASTGLSHL